VGGGGGRECLSPSLYVELSGFGEKRKAPYRKKDTNQNIWLYLLESKKFTVVYKPFIKSTVF